MENYMMYMGADGVYTHTNCYERDESCLVCSAGVPVKASDSMTLREVSCLMLFAHR
jgi:NEDD8-activating enzyme E1